MPHSPRIHGGKLWVLNSGQGELAQVDPSRGSLESVEQVPGYTRGLSFGGQFAFVGMSRIRETNAFGGLPISGRQRSCGAEWPSWTSRAERASPGSSSSPEWKRCSTYTCSQARDRIPARPTPAGRRAKRNLDYPETLTNASDQGEKPSAVSRTHCCSLALIKSDLSTWSLS